MESKKLKIIAIGDLHGKDCWKQINPDNYDRIIFMGDYVDSNFIVSEKINDNLNNLVKFKLKQPEKVTLLLGNHDIQYSEYPHYETSGFHELMQPEYTRIFQDNRELFQVAAQIGNHLFTHAGLSHSYARYYLPEYYDRIIQQKINLAGLLNRIHVSVNQFILHTASEHRGGFEAFGGITWADYKETSKDLLPGYHQVVGHSRRKKITKVERENCSITYIDVLDSLEEAFLQINLTICL